MAEEIVYIKQSYKETIFKANLKGNWNLFKIIKRKELYIRVDDAFARSKGYASLQDLKDKEPDYRKAFDKCMKEKDGYLWLYYNPEIEEFVGIVKNRLN